MLKITKHRTGYYSVHFHVEGRTRHPNVAIFRSEENAAVGYLGIRDGVNIDDRKYPVEFKQANECRDRLAVKVAESTHFKTVNPGKYAGQVWAKLFTPGKNPKAFFNSYTWYSYEKPQRTETFLKETIAGI